MAMFPISCSSLCLFPPPSAASQCTHNGQTLHTANPLRVEPKKTYLTIPFIITTVGFILLRCPPPVCVPFMPFTAGQATAGTQRAEADGQHTNWLLHLLVLREDLLDLFIPSRTHRFHFKGIRTEIIFLLKHLIASQLLKLVQYNKSHPQKQQTELRLPHSGLCRGGIKKKAMNLRENHLSAA